MESAAQALALAQANQEVGSMLVIDVLQAEATAEEAQVRYIDAVIHYNQSQINLLAALGFDTAPGPANASDIRSDIRRPCSR